MVEYRKLRVIIDTVSHEKLLDLCDKLARNGSGFSFKDLEDMYGRSRALGMCIEALLDKVIV